jgi:phosphohistidine phosphatase SixA
VATDYDGELVISAALSPEGRPGKMADLAAGYEKEGAVALVGHEPSMGHLAGKLLDKGGLQLKKGAVVRLDWNPDKHAKLIWVVTPKHLHPEPSLAPLGR